jgi:hypothetical protein
MTERGGDGRFRRRGRSGTTGKRDPERVQAILTGMELGLSRGDAAQAAGIARRTLYDWMAADPAFADAVDQAESRCKRSLLGLVVAAAAKRQANTWQAAAWILERRWPSDFGQKTRLDVSLDLESEIRDLAGKHGLEEQAVLAMADAIIAEHVSGKDKPE